MIKVFTGENYLRVEGHSDTIVCARVSTIAQMTAKSFSGLLEECTVEQGYSLIKVKDDLSETEKRFFRFMIDGMKDLSKLYPNMMEYKEENQHDKKQTSEQRP